MSSHLRLRHTLALVLCAVVTFGPIPARAIAANLEPQVSVPAAVLMAPDGRVLWQRDADARRAMASTTKIMTALVVLDHASPDDEVTVTPSAVGVGESAADLKAGDVFSVRELLEGMLVQSGNDAAQALSEYVAGSESRFVGLMNARADALGLTNTHYANAHGLDQADHYTTARDLAVLTRVAMGEAEFRRIVGLRETRITSERHTLELEASNTMLGEYPGATGVKTGWTNKAGYCVVASAQRQGIELFAVILGARGEEERFAEAGRLMDWGFEHYQVRRLASAEETVGSVSVGDYIDVSVAAHVASDVVLPVFDLDGQIGRTVGLESSIEAPVRRGDRIGTITFTQGEHLLAQVPVVAAEDVDPPGLFLRIWIAIVRAWRSLVSEVTSVSPAIQAI